VIYHQLGRGEEAATAIQRSMEIRPTQRGYSNLGTLLFYMGRYDRAVSAFEQAQQIDANAYQVWGNLGDAYRWAPGKRDQAGGAYLRASQLLDQEIARNPNDPTLLALAATYLAKRGDMTAARATLGRIDLSKKDVPSPILFKAAVVEELAGDRARALSHLEAALSRGYSRQEVSADPELLDLRKDPAYHRIVAQLPPSTP
jgi:serine/threonine-protein kinase